MTLLGMKKKTSKKNVWFNLLLYYVSCNLDICWSNIQTYMYEVI